MQRLQRRTQKAIAHATRQATLQSKRIARLDQVRKDRRNAQQSHYRRSLLAEANQARWEDWHLGPLAPVREESRQDRLKLPERYLENPGKGRNREKARTGRKQAGSVRMLRKPVSHNFKVGDRVCCVAMKGPARKCRGKISTVTEVRVGEKACLVKGLNMIRTNRRPKTLDPNPPKRIHTPIPTSSLVPVRTLINPYTNTREDVLIGLTPNQRIIADSLPIEPSDPFSPTATTRARASLAERRTKRRENREKAAQRAGPEADRKEEKEHEIDTLRYEAEARTWTPSLLRAPMPGGVIEELRGKYSKFRTRHEPEYIQKIEQEARDKSEKDRWAREGGGMLVSPLKELSLKERMEKEEATMLKKKTSKSEDHMPPSSLLEKIGRQMASRGVVTSPEVSGKADVAAAAEALGKDVGVATAERDENLKDERKRGKEVAATYWPVKGWKEKGVKRISRVSVADDHDEGGDGHEGLVGVPSELVLGNRRKEAEVGPR
ncbi:MAG: hypothetical protein Q9217_004944 [Psora testacea]